MSACIIYDHTRKLIYHISAFIRAPSTDSTDFAYSRVPNKRGGENNRGGLEMVRYNNNRGVGIIGGGGCL